MAKKTVKKNTKRTIKKTKSNSKKIIKVKRPLKKKIIKTSKPEIKQAVNKKMLITEITRQYPECALIMMNHGLYCVGCGVAMYETLEDGARAHGMSDLEIDQMIKEMNSAITKK